MTRISKIASLIAVAVALCVAGAAFAQATTTTIVKSGTVIAKYDGKVVVKMDDGSVKEFTPPPGKTVMVEGKQVDYDGLKVGTVLTQEFVKTTKTVPVKTTEIKNATVVKVIGGSLLVQGPDGYKSYDVPAGFTFLVNGQEMKLQDLGPGMKLTATIVSKSTKTVSETEMKSLTGVAPAAPAAPAPAPKAAAAPPPPPPTAAPAPPPPPPPAPAPEKKKLPKTGSPLPLAALGGALSLLAGLGVRSFRRSR
jgi:LPXTG-motif cell wall-anchored protein